MLISVPFGYSLCYLRPEANLAVVSGDEYAAPVVANWQAGAGRVLCYTGEADGAFSGPIAGWDSIGDFLSTLVRWTAGEEAVLPDNMLLTHRVRDGQMIVELHLDPEREAESFANVPVARILHGLPGQPPRSASIPLQWKHADLLEVRVPVRGNETVLPATVRCAGMASLPMNRKDRRDRRDSSERRYQSNTIPAHRIQHPVDQGDLTL